MDLRRTRTALAVLAVALGLAVAAAPLARAQQDRTVHVYRVQHRPAEELVPPVNRVLEGRGSVAADGGGSLVLIGDPGAVSQALALLATLDVAQRTVIVHYRSQRTEELRAAGITVRWQESMGSFRVGSVRVPGGSTFARVAPHGRSDAGSRELSGTLRILEGRTGRIATGALFPVRLEQRGARVVRSQTALVVAESGFEARPRILGSIGQVLIDFFPFSNEPEANGVRTQSAAASAVVHPGETVAIGSVANAVQSSRRSLGELSAQQSRDETVLLLSVEIE